MPPYDILMTAHVGTKLKKSNRVGFLWPVGIFAITKNTYNNIRSKYKLYNINVCFFRVRHHVLRLDIKHRVVFKINKLIYIEVPF